MATGSTIAERTAETVWTGDVREGKGTIKLSSSGAAPDMETSLPTRAEEKAAGHTSPEELMAAAHSSCFSMALSNVLTQDGTPPSELDVRATVALDKIETGFAVSRSRLTVTGRVPGLDQGAFEDAVRRADQGCPVSNALREGLEVEIAEVTLQG